MVITPSDKNRGNGFIYVGLTLGIESWAFDEFHNQSRRFGLRDINDNRLRYTYNSMYK